DDEQGKEFIRPGNLELLYDNGEDVRVWPVVSNKQDRKSMDAYPQSRRFDEVTDRSFQVWNRIFDPIAHRFPQEPGGDGRRGGCKSFFVAGRGATQFTPERRELAEPV